MKNIVLIGMPGAGKSTVGAYMAEVLGRCFYDTDLLIQREENMGLQAIIDSKGITEFLALEGRVLLNLNVSESVIATGGSVVYIESAMEHLKYQNTIVYLKLSYSTIEKRIANILSRGIVLPPGKSLLCLYNERITLYERFSDIIIDCETRDIDSISSEIIRVMGLTEDVVSRDSSTCI